MSVKIRLSKGTAWFSKDSDLLWSLTAHSSAPFQCILVGNSDRELRSDLVVNTVKTIIPFSYSNQELSNLLAAWLNHRGCTVLGWALVTDKEATFSKVAQCYFESFTSAMLKVLIANSHKEVASETSSGQFAEECALLMQSMRGLILFSGIRSEFHYGESFTNSFYTFSYPIGVWEIATKIGNMEQINRDLPCDPIEMLILDEIQQGIGSANGEMDVGLLESLTTATMMGKRFRTRRVVAVQPDGSVFSSGAGRQAPDSAVTSSSALETTHAKVILCENDLEVIFGTGSTFLEDWLQSEGSFCSEYDMSLFSDPCYNSERSNPECQLEADRYQHQVQNLDEILEVYRHKCEELGNLLHIYDFLSQFSGPSYESVASSGEKTALEEV